MLYVIAHFLRDKMPWLWDLVDLLNSFLFDIRYSGKLKKINLNEEIADYKVLPISKVETDELERFFVEQPEEVFKFFKPHEFDANSLKKLQKNNAFLGYVLKNEKQIVGYVFLRSFFTGKCFRGKIVDYRYRGKGLAKTLGMLANKVAYGIGLRMFATVSPENMASLQSSKAVNEVKIIKIMPNGDYFVEELPKKD